MDKPTKINDYAELNTRAIREFNTKYWMDAHENFRMRRGKHWTTTEEAEHKEQKRIPYSIGIVEAKFATIESQQMQTPFEIVAIPRTIDDEVNAEIKNAIFKYVGDLNELNYLQSEWYRDGIVKKYGVIKRYIDTSDDPEGEIKLRKMLFNYIVWDTNCKVYDVARNVGWVQEYGYYQRDQLIDMFPQKAKEIESLPDKGNYKGEEENDLIEYVHWYRTDHKQDLIKVVWHYQRKYKKYYKVYLNNGKFEDRDEKPEVTEADEEQQALDLAAGMIYPVDYLPRTREYIEVTCFSKVGEILLDEYEIDSKIMPFHWYFANFDDGEFWSLMDMVKDPQRFLDRLTSQIDASIGKLIKNSYQLEWDLLHEEDKKRWVTLEKKLLSGGAVLRTRGGANGGKIIHPIDSGSIPSELFTTWQFMVTVLEEALGGRNAQGLKEKGQSNESGVAIQSRAELGFLMAYIYISNLGRSLKSLGEGLNEDINKIYGNSVDKVIEITDNDLDPLVLEKFKGEGMYQEAQLRPGRGFLSVPQNLGEARTRIIIEKGEYSPSQKARKQLQWKMINEMMIAGGEEPYPFSLFMDDFEIDASRKAKIRDFDEKREKMKAQNREIEMRKLQLDANNQQIKNVSDGYKILADEEAKGNEPKQPANKN